MENVEQKKPSKPPKPLRMTSIEETVQLARIQQASLSSSALYERKRNKKVLKVVTVGAYILFVSMAAITLSIYYVFIWDPAATKPPTAKAATICDTQIIIPENIAVRLANSTHVTAEKFYKYIYQSYHQQQQRQQNGNNVDTIDTSVAAATEPVDADTAAVQRGHAIMARLTASSTSSTESPPTSNQTSPSTPAVVAAAATTADASTVAPADRFQNDYQSINAAVVRDRGWNVDHIGRKKSSNSHRYRGFDAAVDDEGEDDDDDGGEDIDGDDFEASGGLRVDRGNETAAAAALSENNEVAEDGNGLAANGL